MSNSEWTSIKGYDNYFYCDSCVISESKRRGRILKTYTDKNNRKFVRAWKDGKLAKLFIDTIKIKEEK